MLKLERFVVLLSLFYRGIVHFSFWKFSLFHTFILTNQIYKILYKPGCYHGCHSNRLPNKNHFFILRDSTDHFSVHSSGLFRKPFEESGAVSDLAAGLGQRFTLLGGQEFGQIFLIRYLNY
jgi:hypothetical protein